MRVGLRLTVVVGLSLTAVSTVTSSSALATVGAGAAAQLAADAPSALALIQHNARSEPSGLDVKSSLPEVETVLSRASDAAEAFAKQAAAMRSNVAEMQEAAKVELSRKKALYAQQLEEQQVQLAKLQSFNEQIRTNASYVEHLVSLAEKRSDQVNKVNNLVREAIVSVQPKITAVRNFITDSVERSRIGDADEVKVLSSESPPQTLEHFLQMARQQLKVGSGKLSLLAGSSGDAPDMDFSEAVPEMQKPEDLVRDLSKSLRRLAAAEAAGEKELKAAYEGMFSSGEEDHKKSKAEAVELEERLRVAKDRLQVVLLTESKLRANNRAFQQPLYGLSVFAKKLDKVISAALQKASKFDEDFHT